MSTKKEALEFERALEDARKVRETMKTEGWKIIEKILQEGIQTLDSLRGVESMKEVIGRQHAGRILQKFLASLTDIVQRVGEAETRLLPSEESIYRIMKGTDK